MGDLRPWREMLPILEGRTAFIYPDGNGLPTCGVGHALQTPEDAVVVFADPRARADWETIRHSLTGQALHLYEPLTVCRLSDEQIDRWLARDVDEHEARLFHACPDAPMWPVNVQEVAKDIVYNTGGIKFPRMLAAIRAEDWDTAAEQSNRPQVQDARNQWTAAMILSAKEAV